MSRQRVIVIPNLAAWIIGEMSKHVMYALRDRFEFYFIPESLLYRRPDMVRALLPGTSLIHAMNESATSLLARTGVGELPPVITWIHHITKWSADHDFAARHSAALIACTPAWKAAIEELSPQPVPVHLIRHGVDSEFFKPVAGTRARFGIPHDAFVAGFIAHRGSDSDDNRKGFPILLDVVKSVAARIPNFYLLMLGPGWEKPVEELRAGGIRAQYINFLPRSEVPALYSALNVYLMTARVEGGPCTVLESMACAIPVVATQVGLVPDVIEDGLNGFSAPVDDVRALADAVLSLAGDHGRAAQIGRQARISAQQHSWCRSLAPLGDIYQRYLRPVANPSPQRAWMQHPESLTGPAHAADVIINAWDALRKSSSNMPTTLRMMANGLEGLSVPDILRGTALLKGLDFLA
jgi:glycosyltransferase involved in cell wall biosynthesis